MQFPLRPKCADVPAIDHARFKPRHKKLELSVPYDADIIGNDDTMSAGTSQKFVSTALHETPFMAIGVIRDGALHLTSVEDVLQIRPSFDGIRRGEITEDMEDSDDEGQAETAPDSKKKTLQQVHIHRKESERTEYSRLNSYTSVRSREEAEPWVEMAVHPPGETMTTS